MITAVTLRRVGQLNTENQALRNRMEAFKAERDYLLRRLADYQNLEPTQPTANKEHLND